MLAPLEPPPVTPYGPPSRLPRLERQRGAGGLRAARRLRRPAVIVALAVATVVATVVVQDRIVGAYMHEQRQQRLAADFKVPAPERVVRPGEPIAVIQSADIGLNEVVIEGDSTANLRSGPARRTGSALPGEPGRTVILGHGGAFGGPFGRIDELEPGATIAVQTRNGGPIVAYVVRDVLIEARAGDVAEPDDGIAQLVLVSSEGGWFRTHSVVVVASTLPVIDSPPRIEALSLDASDRGVPFGSEALVANLAALAAALAWFGLRGRHNPALVVGVITPIALFAVTSYLLAFDTILPSTR